MVMPINLRRRTPRSAATTSPRRASSSRSRSRTRASGSSRSAGSPGRSATSPRSQLTDALAGVLNQLPTTITTALFGSMLKGADFVTSNVPGAPFPIFSGGAELERMYAFAPLAGRGRQRDAALATAAPAASGSTSTRSPSPTPTSSCAASTKASPRSSHSARDNASGGATGVLGPFAAPRRILVV